MQNKAFDLRARRYLVSLSALIQFFDVPLDHIVDQRVPASS